MQVSTLKYAPEGAFFKSLKNAVELHFERNKTSPYADYRLYVKSIILLGLWVFSYIYILLEKSPPGTTLVLCVILGMLSAFVNFNIMHDASHGAYSKNKTVNTWLARTLNLVGGSDFFWKIKHVSIHHAYVNSEHDDDIETNGLIRMSPHQEWKWYHKYQHRYALLLYAFLAIQWIYIADIQKYVQKKVHTKIIPEIPKKERYVFRVTKILHIVLFMLIPGLIFNWYFLIGWLVYFMTVGVFISIVFQLAHVHEHAHFTESTDGKMPTSWAEQQVYETMDFATRSKTVTWFLGGLNFQTIHHLFPKISHIHYPDIQKIVVEKCKEFNTPYTRVTLLHAIKSHFAHLKEMGKKPVTV